MWILCEDGKAAVNLDHIERLEVYQKNGETKWHVKGMDRYASYFWFGPFDTEKKAKDFIRTVCVSANAGPKPRPDERYK